jgi:hypothetical protein
VRVHLSLIEENLLVHSGDIRVRNLTAQQQHLRIFATVNRIDDIGDVVPAPAHEGVAPRSENP